jgi:hypothetical protein
VVAVSPTYDPHTLASAAGRNQRGSAGPRHAARGRCHAQPEPTEPVAIEPTPRLHPSRTFSAFAYSSVKPPHSGRLLVVTWEEVLTVLLGWVGRRLSVAIATAGDAPVMLANMTGRLRAGAELSPDDTEGPAVYFHFDDAGTGFLLARAHFEGGGWHEQDPSTLLVRLGAVTLWIDQDPDE